MVLRKWRCTGSWKGTSSRLHLTGGEGTGTSEIFDETFLPLKTSRKTVFYLLGITLFWAAIYVPGLFSPPMMDDVDSLHAEAAREMLERGDYVTLHANGVRYLDKAPFLYWLTAGSYKVFGFTELGTRLPLSLLSLATFLAAFFLARDLAGEEAGLFAGLVLATALGPYIYTRFLIPDLVVGLWLTITVHLLFRSFDSERPSLELCWGLAVVTALNVLTKGLIGVIFPVGILGAYLLLTGGWRHLLKLRLVSSTIIFFLVAAPWHVLAILRNPPQGAAKGFFWFYFINEQVNRYLNTRIPRDYDKVPLLIFWGLLLVWVLPWSGFFVASLKQVPWRFRQWRSNLSRGQRGLLLMAIWALVILVFFSFSTRQEYYVIPALPALAVLTGVWLAKEAQSSKGSELYRAGMISAVVLAVLGIAICAVTLPIAASSQPLPPGTDLSDALKQATQMYTLSTGHLFDLTPKAMGAFRLPLVLTGLGFLLGTVLSWFYRRRLQYMQANIALAAMMVVVLFAVHLALITFNPILGSKPLADVVQRDCRAGDVVVLDGEYTLASSINFYTGIRLHFLNGTRANLWFGSLFPDVPPVFETDESFAKLWAGPTRVFFIIFKEGREQYLNQLGRPVYEVARSGGKTIYCNQPLQ